MAKLHTALREQARHLATRERKKPKQASLRRAISAGYYALFHRLTHDAARFLIASASKPHRKSLQFSVRRAFDHGSMAQVARSFAGGTPREPWKSILPGGVPSELSRVGRTFIDLQEKRHEADYDLRASFSRPDTLALLSRLDRSFDDLNAAPSEAKEVFLTALAFHGRVRA